MKALSIKQPWASLIAHGIKDIENRTWKTKFRGRIYIHASAKSAGNTAYLLTKEQDNFFAFNTENYKTFESNLPYSAIIGEVDIVDCVINHPSIWAEKTDLYKANSKEYPDKIIYNWVLANAVLYDKPTLNVKGKLSFWEWKGCEQTCESCEKDFDLETMQRDGDDNYFCKECADELFPVMQKEYEECYSEKYREYCPICENSYDIKDGESEYFVKNEEDAKYDNEVAGIYHLGDLIAPININYLKKIDCGDSCSEVYSDDICPDCVSDLVRKDNFMKSHGHGTPCILIKKYETDSLFKDWTPERFKLERQRLIHKRITIRGIIETANKKLC